MSWTLHGSWFSFKLVIYQNRGYSAKITKWNFPWFSHIFLMSCFQETLPFPELGMTSQTFLVVDICFGTCHLQFWLIDTVVVWIRKVLPLPTSSGFKHLVSGPIVCGYCGRFSLAGRSLSLWVGFCGWEPCLTSLFLLHVRERRCDLSASCSCHRASHPLLRFLSMMGPYTCGTTRQNIFFLLYISLCHDVW